MTRRQGNVVLFACLSAVAVGCGDDDTQNCWDPPTRHCEVASDAETWFCSPEGTRCCLQRNSCGPCGWLECYVPCEDDAGCEPRAGCPGPLRELESRRADWP